MSWFKIVGTSHIAKEAVKKIEKAFDAFAPDVVGVELDQGRFMALLHNEKPNYSPKLIPQIGVRGYLVAVIATFVQRRLGNIVKVQPGTDMLSAALLAQKNRKRILLMDQEVRITLKRLSKAFGWREVKQIFKDLWAGMRGERLSFDPAKIPSAKVIEKLLKEFSKRYPRPFKVLVADRNKYMARSLLRFHELNPDDKILVVLGAGHEKGVIQLLEKGQSKQQPI